MPNPSSEELNELAERLTEPQRRALVNARCAIPRTQKKWTAECVCSVGPNMFAELAKMGLMYRREAWPHGYLLTPSGEAIAASLRSRGRG